MRIIMEYEPYYYHYLAGKEDKWQEPPLKNLVEYLEKNTRPGSKILDVGCGTGNILQFLPQGADYIGLDQSEFAVRDAKKAWEGYANAKFFTYAKPELPYGKESFDIVLLLFSLEHVKHPKEILLECAGVLKKCGAMIILAPNLEFPFAWPNALRHKSFWYKIMFRTLRTLDYLKRIFGGYSFRVLDGNIMSEKGIYRKKDDDLWHMVSSWEVIKFLEGRGLALKEFWREKEVAGWRRFAAFLPTLRWFGVSLAAVFEKR